MQWFDGALYVGSTGTPALAVWTGAAWATPGLGGVNGAVRAMAEYGGALVIAGDFSSAGGGAANAIAQWTGAVFEPLGDGLGSSVTELAVYNGVLIAAGTFLSPRLRIAQWNGGSWASFGTGIRMAPTMLAAYNGRLYISGDADHYTYLNYWTGSNWNSLQVPPDGAVNCIASYNGYMIVGGSFITVAVSVTVNHIAMLSSNWYKMGSGTNDDVTALAVYNGLLLVGGRFTYAGGVYSPLLAAWNGNRWSAFAGGTGDAVYAFVLNPPTVLRAIEYYAAGATGTCQGPPLNMVVDATIACAPTPCTATAPAPGAGTSPTQMTCPTSAGDPSAGSALAGQYQEAQVFTASDCSGEPLAVVYNSADSCFAGNGAYTFATCWGGNGSFVLKICPDASCSSASCFVRAIGDDGACVPYGSGTYALVQCRSINAPAQLSASAGATAGIVVGAVLGVLVLVAAAAAVLWFYRHRRGGLKSAGAAERTWHMRVDAGDSSVIHLNFTTSPLYEDPTAASQEHVPDEHVAEFTIQGGGVGGFVEPVEA